MTTRRDTGPASLPSIPAYRGSDPSLAPILNSMKEWIEVRSGSRGNDAERAVTQRELVAVKAVTEKLTETRKPGVGEMVITVGGLQAVVAIQRFEDLIRGTKLYSDLRKRLDDPRRFDDLRGEVREMLLRSIAEEARLRGAAVTRTEKIVEDMRVSLAIRMEEVTAALDQSAAGVRETMFASAEANRSQAGRITQVEASLGNYYQDGTLGRASLEAAMTATADSIDGLSAQYTLKVQAGGALAGFGIAAEEVNGTPSSAFIISADKFAVVNPSYNGGLTNTPDASTIPFGVDANGIYLNNNVYVKGQMRVDTGGRTLLQGLRGSLLVTIPGTSWSDAAARQAIWARLGYGGSAPNNNHLVIGDTVTVSPPGGSGAIARTWNDSAWIDPGAMFSGSMVIDGSLAAQKIDTRGLNIKDDSGNIIFSSGVNLDKNRVAGLGAFAGIDQINAGNVSTFIQSAAIGNAQLGGFIRSDNFISGISGWNIEKSGAAEFDLVTIRRRYVVATGTYDPTTMVSNYRFSGGDDPKGLPGAYITIPVLTNVHSLNTGITDNTLRDEWALQPWSASVFAWGDDALRLFTSRVGPHEINIAYSATVTAARTYSSTGSWPQTNTLRINIVAHITTIRGQAQFRLPLLRWILYRI